MAVFSTCLLVLLAVTATSASCNPNAATTRREWGSLHPAQRTEYIDAILCLRHRPSVIPSSQYPGVRDRLDDFVATHINYTSRIHDNALLLPWHRHFLFLWERTLQDECGYTGGVPYWNWSLATSNLSASPIFDGTNTSLSGNGAFDPAACDGHCNPGGSGGGCVTSGPFKDYQVHLGPFNNSDAEPHKPPPLHAFDYNPRCLQRDFNPQYLAQYNNATVLEQLRAATDIDAFLTLMDPSREGVTGAHGGGHRAVGGAMSDVYSSPQDPSFMLHHGMADRMWALWQGGDMETRREALNGTAVMHDEPGGTLVTPDFVTEFGVLDRPRTVRELMDPMRYDYCYRYE
ncbi:hypothetical protein FE257_004225 [Aspergillus nanangensis]|uniref:Tyrosinase copper-binding domain-containing protein n=1 Tax=Aspergillus nanangensis TaxID=2582783 RepID=A0AAD4CRI2_ASPNN|nr:hypothetical protein FE257_004225 [Aspergillus nanangensis]